MKKVAILLIAGMILQIPLYSQNAQPGGPLGGLTPDAKGWNDQFVGSINGTSSILTLQQNGSNLSGNVNADGYIYILAGTVNGNQSSGQLTDSNTQGVMSYTATLAGNRVSLQLVVPGNYGQSSQLQLTFERKSSGGGTSGPAPGALSPGGQQNVQRDQSIIGGWRHTSTYTSGDFGAVSEWYMQIFADGTYRYGDGKMMGGDGGSSFDSGQGGASTGHWKTENKVVYINEGAGWQPYATYIVDSNSMLFKFGDGSKQLWERYQ